MRTTFDTLRRLSCFAMIASCLVFCGTANAQIVGVADSRVQGFFSSQNGFFFRSWPNGMGFQAPPAAGNPVGGLWLPFAPLPQTFIGTDNAWIGARTFCRAEFQSGFTAPGNSVLNTFVVFTQMPYLLQEGGAVGVAYLRLNYSVDYNVGAGGLFGGPSQLIYPLFGRLSPIPGSYAVFHGELTPWFIGANGVPVQLAPTNALHYDTRQNGIFVGPFAQLLQSIVAIPNVPGPGILRLTGYVHWEGDPSETYVGTEENPQEEGSFITGTVQLNDWWSDDTAAPMTLEFRPTDGGPTISRTTYVQNDGSFMTRVPRKEYTVRVKYGKRLSKLISVNAIMGDVSDLTITDLAGGDANDDNCVDLLDLDLLIQAFDTASGDPTYNQDADFNGDGYVDLLDLAVLIGNLDTCGEE